MMSIYCSFGGFSDDSDDHPAPFVYSGSHVMPTPDSPRGGVLDLGYIPGYVTLDGKDRNGDPDPGTDEGVWPYLRVSLSPVQPPAVQRWVDRKGRAYGRVLRAVIRLRRLGIRVPVPSWQWPADTVVLDRDQVQALRDHLTDWLFRCDDPDAWLAESYRSHP